MKYTKEQIQATAPNRQVNKILTHVVDLKDFKEDISTMSDTHLKDYVKALKAEWGKRGLSKKTK